MSAYTYAYICCLFNAEQPRPLTIEAKSPTDAALLYAHRRRGTNRKEPLLVKVAHKYPMRENKPIHRFKVYRVVSASIEALKPPYS